MKRIISLSLIMFMTLSASASNMLRGVVYDVGLMYGGTSLSLENFEEKQVAYDMDIIAHVLNCNAVRIEGEDVSRLKIASELAHKNGLRVFFNPWKHEATPEQNKAYMMNAAKEAEKLRQQGADITFVMGCEYSIFCKGAFPGDTFNERLGWLMNMGGTCTSSEEAFAKLTKQCEGLNRILADACSAVRKEFKGKVTYSSGTWELVDWSLFDIVGIDHYRNGESEEQYVSAIDRYKIGKPIFVMEMGCCAYQGAAPRGGNGFGILLGQNADGTANYEGGITPKRSEKEQADYIETVLGLLDKASIDGVFVYVFRYPIYPYRDHGVDLDMTSYSLVKSFDSTDPRSKAFPSWQPKEAFFRTGQCFTRMANDKMTSE